MRGSPGARSSASAVLLRDNPRDVLIVDLEDYTTPRDTQALLKSTGLADYVYRGPQGPPWPTVQRMKRRR
jgi:hypothetical protein